MTRRLILAATIFMGGTAAHSQDVTDQVIDRLQQDGFTRIEVQRGLTETKVEAIRGQMKLEVVYDRETGDVLKQETEAVGPGDDTAPGLQVRNRNRDFLDDDGRGRGHDSSDDDDDDDDDRSGHRSGGSHDDDDDDDDRSGRGGGGSHDDDDDHDDDHGGRGDDDDSDDD